MKSLAVKYRPDTFDSVKCQHSVIKILTRQIELKDFSNVYLFCGPSGCGKTTIARIFANLVNDNQGHPIEIDAASNNGVDNVRNIINSANERSLDSEYKIYIIDEAHMLSTQAWNALLKTIEEPPKYTLFLFCTTDPQKIPDTIKNRCMRFNLTRIPAKEIYDRLVYICEEEGFINYADTCDFISRTSKGQLRDAIATLEKCASYSTDLSIENSLNAINLISYETLFELINSVIDGNEQSVLELVDKLYLDGHDLKLFIEQFLEFCLDIGKYCICKDITITKFPAIYEKLINQSIGFDNNISYYNYVIDKLFELRNILKTDLNTKTTIDIYMLKITRCQ